MMWNVNPWRELERIRREMDSLVGERGSGGYRSSFPFINTHDTGEEIVLIAELPGVKKDDVSIVIENGTLSISGKRETPSVVSDAVMLRKERSEGGFEKKIRVPVKVNENSISADFQNGVLTVRLPKADEARAKKISIN